MTATTGASTAAPKNALPPISVGINEAARLTGLGRSTIYRRIEDGTLRHVKVGKRTLIPYAALAALCGGAEPR